MRFLFFPLFTLLSVISAQADSVPAPNPPKVGKYVGVATITKDFFPERMSTKVTVRAYANVFNNSGDLSIMAVVPESPMAAAANPESTISRGVWQPDGTYLMDGKHRATLTLVGDSFQLSFASPAPTFSGGTGPLEGSFPDGLPEIIPAATTRIHYRFYPQTQASTRRAR